MGSNGWTLAELPGCRMMSADGRIRYECAGYLFRLTAIGSIQVLLGCYGWSSEHASERYDYAHAESDTVVEVALCG